MHAGSDDARKESFGSIRRGAMAARAPIGGPCAWRGAELRGSDRWQRSLDGADIAEIEAALDGVVRRGLDSPEIGRADFPLPRLGTKLAGIARELEDGCGLVRLCRLPVERFTDVELRSIFFGVGSHLGTPCFQNAQGELLRAITDEGGDRGARYGVIETGAGDPFLSSRARVASTGELRFHNDRADVVALLCVRAARTGGLTRVASAAAVHDAMLVRRPDLLEVLYAPIWRSRLGEEIGGERACYPLPVFAVRDGKLTTHYSRTYIEAAQLRTEVPRMSDAQWEAFELLAEIAAEACIEWTLAPGEIQLLNSHATFHARTAYEDDEDAARKRLLYRLWLCPPDARALPPGHAVLWGETEPGRPRGGIARHPLA